MENLSHVWFNCKIQRARYIFPWKYLVSIQLSCALKLDCMILPGSHVSSPGQFVVMEMERKKNLSVLTRLNCHVYLAWHMLNLSLNLCFNIPSTRKFADIYPLLETDDMIMMKNKPDWKCVFTYVQALYRGLHKATGQVPAWGPGIPVTKCMSSF